MTNANGGLKVGDVALDQGIRELMNAYLIQESKDSTAVPSDHPVIARQRRLADNTRSLEDKVKDVLGSSVRADKSSADKIIHALAYELAKTEGFHGKPEEFTEEKARTYLTQASSALGNPTIGNKTEFTKSVINMAAAKPGDPLYDSNSALGQLIQYISSQKDDGSRRINFLQTLLQEHGTQPGYVSAMHSHFGEAVGKRYNSTASVADLIGDLTRKGQLQSQQHAAEAGPKTYHAPGAYVAH